MEAQSSKTCDSFSPGFLHGAHMGVKNGSAAKALWSLSQQKMAAFIRIESGGMLSMGIYTEQANV